ncbi:MAG TPA: preprotein translocase subunit YajC [Allosphingosinicella sp.]|jgi:preprotein translocase subunit YajC|uniref:preprotein translocase subunit YajC n=1 Tax=Allosphingosinicella sp. TaxID=2823234 RepID=UPI002F28E6D3
MFASPAYAQAAGAAAPSGTASFLVSTFPLVLIFVIFYFLLIRPQQRRAKQHQAMIGAVKKNDVVVTGGGLVGKVTRVDEAEVEVELAPNVRVKALKGTLTDVRPHGQKPAND